MLATLGLFIICIAWIYQYSLVKKGDKTLNQKFVGGYTFGVLLLVIDGFMAGGTSITWLNFFSFLIAAWIFYTLKKGK